MSYHTVINNTIALCLEQNNLTEKQLAERMNMSEEAFHQKRCGREEFTLFELTHLSGILGVTLDEITGISKADQIKFVPHYISKTQDSMNINIAK